MTNLQNSMFDFAYRIAMREAVLMRAYKGKKKSLHEIKGAKNAVSELVIDILKGTKFNSQTSYDTEFYKTAEEVCRCINAEIGNNFTFGNAQKLINITLKYMYLRCYDNLNERSKFQYCHCPMDNIMLNRVWDKCSENSNPNLKNIFKTKADFTTSWGNEKFPKKDTDRYKLFQETVKELAQNINLDYNRLDYDYMMW